MTSHLVFRAGRKAYALIRDRGLSPEMVSVVAGAAGGPKWIILNGLDRAIFFDWIEAEREQAPYLVGSSIGAWRFAAFAHRNAPEAVVRFQQAYINQRYEKVPTPAEVTGESLRILNIFLGDPAQSGILSHRSFRLSILADRSRGLLRHDRFLPLAAGLALTALGNLLSRKTLGLFLERALFYDNRDIPPFYGMDGFPVYRVPLSVENLKQALMASGSIPLVMEGIKDIAGAPRGLYRDGGLIDYHLDIPYNTGQGIVLYPHFVGRIIPGWFDKTIPWRKPSPENMDSVLLITPSEAFVETLPLGKIPDRNDFKLFKFRDDERINYWNRALDQSRCLGDEFLEAVTTGRIRNMVQPM
ncbi:MAG TPA: patatin-like phospholipase family protein [Spirochaetes bacterium]|nr:patatin-like phospholipase family protein [Spirochaetota bacterium]